MLYMYIIVYLYMYMHMYMYMHVYIYIYTRIYVCICVYILYFFGRRGLKMSKDVFPHEAQLHHVPNFNIGAPATGPAVVLDTSQLASVASPWKLPCGEEIGQFAADVGEANVWAEVQPKLGRWGGDWLRTQVLAVLWPDTRCFRSPFSIFVDVSIVIYI